MNGNLKSRKWQITINNPVDKGYTHEKIKAQLSLFKSIVYYAISDEIGEEGTFHTHIYFACSNGTRFETIKKRFEGGHFELANGTSMQNREYVFKEGEKWAKSKKAETNIKESHEEWGEMPVERQGMRSDLCDLYDSIKSGLSNFEIIEENPGYMFNVEKIEKVRQTIREEEFKNIFRQLEVTYIYGLSGTGKTRGVMDNYGYENVYRITDYDHPFDQYKGQDVVIFEEFRSSLKIQDMLNYLDGYPLMLPCRYSNRVACFTKVFILTNVSLDAQYPNIIESETWKAFNRRIHNVIKYIGYNQYITEKGIYPESSNSKSVDVTEFNNLITDEIDILDDLPLYPGEVQSMLDA